MTPDYWPAAKTHLAKKDKVLRKLMKVYPDARLNTRGNPFQTLARSIVGQQISVKAAQSVWNRFAEAAGRVEPHIVVAMPDETLRACGFSGQKTKYVKDLARHFHEGLVKPRTWKKMEDEAVIEIAAALPKLAKEGRLQAIRRRPPDPATTCRDA